MAKIKLEKNKRYNIKPIKGENYLDCEFKFGVHTIADVDGQYFKTYFKSRKVKPNEDNTWWDSEGFDITETKCITE